MSDNPLAYSEQRERRIQERARQLWEADGRPNGQEAEYREQAETLVRMEESAGAGQLPNPETHVNPYEGVDEAQIQKNYGEFPGRMTDQGDWRQTPMTKDELHDWEEGKTQPTRGDAP